MSGVARYVKFTAQPGHGEDVAQLLLRAADSVRDTKGCELYMVNRAKAESDVVWVTEVWMDQASLDESVEQLRSEEGQARIAEVMDLLQGRPEAIELEPLGGVGYVPGGAGYTHVNLGDVEDMAPRFGLGEMGESRFANRALGTVRTGVSHQRLRPGVRQGFGHRHRHAEEVVVVLAGRGQVKIDDEIRAVAPLDAIRVAPGSARAFEAGAEGLELLIFGPRHTGDAVIERNFWPTEAT